MLYYVSYVHRNRIALFQEKNKGAQHFFHSKIYISPFSPRLTDPPLNMGNVANSRQKTISVRCVHWAGSGAAFKRKYYYYYYYY